MRSIARLLVFGVMGCGSAVGERDTLDACLDPGCADAGTSAMSGVADDTSPSTEDGGTQSDAADDAAPGEGLPCDVVDVLSRNCFGCHSDPPKFGAPMPLASHADFQVPAKTDPTRAVRELAAERIVDPERPMPPIQPMDAADRAVLLDWLAAGAPADEGSDCVPTDPGDDDDVGPDALPCEPTHRFVAHAQGSADGFHVPESGADNLYMCFTFDSPFGATTQGTAWAPITDDERVIHHWILFGTATEQPDGGVGPCNMPGDAVFVAGWAPGGQNYVMPDDVGLELGGQATSYILQVHYHNTEQHTDALDGSGVAFCTTDTPRANTAGVLTLGTLSIDIPADTAEATATGTCPSDLTSLLPTSLQVLASFPHMHQRGRKFRTTIDRGGAESMLVDVPAFSFDNQISYPNDPPIEIRAGDTLTTTCTYENTGGPAAGFGEKTEDEMCFNFVLTYPINLIPNEYRACMTG